MTDENPTWTEERQLQGRRLEARVRSRWTAPGGARALAAEMGLSRATLYSWFRGHTAPDTRQLTLLAKVLYASPMRWPRRGPCRWRIGRGAAAGRPPPAPPRRP